MTASAKWYLATVVVVLAVIVAVIPRLLSSGGEPADGGGQVVGEASTSSVVAPRPDCPAAGVAGVELPCLGGAENPAGASKPTLVNLWAWWCGPCRTELPIIDQFAAAHPEYEVVGVHADANAGNGAMMLNDLGISLPSYQDDSNLFAGRLGLPSVVPITMLVSAQGEVLATFPRTFDSLGDLESAVGEVQG
ncbi:TlpA family protein disulfide reductase [Corynebacterium pacaense]|uniref:TlpA family protein disulfide reductase n=1 Tax=Corynebacterium pacaense TaxID=1816684 RepID=UPI0009BC2055|nr:TlpA disulfide reductase family protein [Corynebacterium pacaense]